jgi:hypothetical protein
MRFNRNGRAATRKKLCEENESASGESFLHKKRVILSEAYEVRAVE